MQPCLLVISLFSSTVFAIGQVALNQEFFQAVAKGDAGAVHVLLDNGADLEATNDRGETALFIAVENRNRQIVELLLEKGAQVSARDKYQQTALTEAARSMDPDMLRTLLAANPDREDKNAALFEAAESAPVVLQMADSPGPSASQNQQATKTPAELPWVTSVRLLLDSGADIEARDAERETPLMRAAAFGQTETFELLLQRGAQISVTDKRGMTPLMVAACACAIATMNSTYDIMKLLLERGANVNARDHDGTTALMMAAASPDGSPSVKLLLDKGANPMAKDSKGRTALDFAKDTPFPEKIQQLKKAMATSR